MGYSNACLATCFRCAPFVLNANPLSRDFFLVSASLFVQARRVADIRKHPLYKRVFALAGAIGIEPTQWESEAQVLPLHQAPSQR